MKICSIQPNYSNRIGVRKNLNEGQTTSMPQPAAPAPNFCGGPVKTLSAAVLAGLLAIVPAVAKEAPKGVQHHPSGITKLFTNALEHRLVSLFQKANTITRDRFTDIALLQRDSADGEYANVSERAMDLPGELAHNIITILNQEPEFKGSSYGKKVTAIISRTTSINDVKSAKKTAGFADRINRILNDTHLSKDEIRSRVKIETLAFVQNYTNAIHRQITEIDEQMVK